MADRKENHPVGCGYGLLGLCCDSCLRGPCRRSPFDDATGGGDCGEDGDWMVANNLLERVLLESLQAMATFRDRRSGTPVRETRSRRRVGRR
jgi:hydroxylamine reductase (hybrid-cluster protein)